MESDPSSQETESITSILHRFRFPLALGSISFVLIVLSITLLIKSVQTTIPIRFSSTNEASPSGQDNLITVDVEGAVIKPGMYRLAEGKRVEDALMLAGGLSKEADTARIAQTINRASKLSDGAKLYFFTNADSPDANIVRRPAEQGSSNSVSNMSTVSVNIASQSQLEALPGIGPVTATKIITGRPYQTLDELVTKKTMNRSLFEKLKDQLTL